MRLSFPLRAVDSALEANKHQLLQRLMLALAGFYCIFKPTHPRIHPPQCYKNIPNILRRKNWQLVGIAAGVMFFCDLCASVLCIGPRPPGPTSTAWARSVLSGSVVCRTSSASGASCCCRVPLRSDYLHLQSVCALGRHKISCPRPRTGIWSKSTRAGCTRPFSVQRALYRYGEKSAKLGTCRIAIAIATNSARRRKPDEQKPDVSVSESRFSLPRVCVSLPRVRGCSRAYFCSTYYV